MPLELIMKKAVGIWVILCSLSFGSALAAEHEVGIGPSFKGPVGLQLYSLRASFAKDVPGTLDKVKSFGIKYVELASTYNLPHEQFKKMLDERGLVGVSVHFPYERFRDDAEGIAR